MQGNVDFDPAFRCESDTGVRRRGVDGEGRGQLVFQRNGHTKIIRWGYSLSREPHTYACTPEHNGNYLVQP